MAAGEWQLDPMGVIHLGDDGVLRSFSENFTVLNYAPLHPDEIDQLNARFPDYEAIKEHYKDVDGRNVIDLEALMNPAQHLLPQLAPQSQTQTSPRPNLMKKEDQACVDIGCITNAFCDSHFCYGCTVQDSRRSGRCNIDFTREC